MSSRDWATLKVSQSTKRFIQEQAFARMTPVQAIAIPLLLNHRDVAVEACTGSGKTLAFLIPVVEILMRCSDTAAEAFNVGSAVLAPTRELAGQIHEVLGSYLAAVAREDAKAGARLSSQLFVGGSEAKQAAEAVRRSEAAGRLQIVVATPGRLRAVMDLTSKTELNLKPLEVLVLDEADRLLQLGFEMDINTILGAVPKQRRTGLFSATLTSELKRLMKTGMRNPVHVCVRMKKSAGVAANEDAKKDRLENGDAKEDGPKDSQGEKTDAVSTRHEVPSRLQNYYVDLTAPEKLAFLKDFLNMPEVRKGKTIVFFLTCACVDFFHGLLRELVDGESDGKLKSTSKKGKNVKSKATPRTGRVEKLHGQMDQLARAKAYEKFCKSPLSDGSVLLATDLAARGIDVEAVSWVIQFDAPLDPASFVHRIGRAARAGQSGKSLMMLLPHEDGYVPFLRQRGIPMEELPTSVAPATWRDENANAKRRIAPSGDVAASTQRAKRLVETDRTIMLRSSKAFVSFVRAYQEHQLPYLFPLKKLDLGGLATSFCLLRLPRMKEILGKKIKNFQQSAINPIDVPFRDKAQEKLRQEKLAKKREEAAAEAEAAGVSATEEQQKKEIKQAEDKPEKERTRTQKRQAKRRGKQEEWRLLQAEECLAKQMRKGKITAKQFRERMKKVTQKEGGDDDNEDGLSMSDSSDDDGPSRRKGKRKQQHLDEDEGTDARWLKKRKRRRSKRGKA